MEERNKKILLVEDDPNFGTVLKDYLMMNDYDGLHWLKKYGKKIRMCLLYF